MAAILQMLHSNRTGENVVPYSQGKFSPLFLWRAHWQSGFNDSIGRMQCDYKSMGRRKRLDLLAFEASAAKTNVGNDGLLTLGSPNASPAWSPRTSTRFTCIIGWKPTTMADS